MQTTLHLLTRDGAVFLAFRPSLSSNQYAALRKLVSSTEAADELRLAVVAWASKEGLEVILDEAEASRLGFQ